MHTWIAALGCCLSVLLTTPLTRAQEFLWARQLGGSGTQVRALRVAVDAAGNVYTTGVLSTVNAWCSERADFYRDGYLANATGGIFLFTGGRAQWWSNVNSAFQWVGPDYGGYPNGFGFACAERPYTWCSMSGLGG